MTRSPRAPLTALFHTDPPFTLSTARFTTAPVALLSCTLTFDTNPHPHGLHPTMMPRPSRLKPDVTRLPLNSPPDADGSPMTRPAKAYFRKWLIVFRYTAQCAPPLTPRSTSVLSQKALSRIVELGQSNTVRPSAHK